MQVHVLMEVTLVLQLTAAVVSTATWFLMGTSLPVQLEHLFRGGTC